MRKVVLLSLSLVVLVVAFFVWKVYEEQDRSARLASLEKKFTDAQQVAMKARERAERWSEHGNIGFREVACKGHPPGTPPRVVTSAWDGDVLAIKAPVCVNCVQHVENVDAKVDGNNLVLTITSTKIGDIVAACDCERLAEIRIKALPKRDYNIVGVEPVDMCI